MIRAGTMSRGAWILLSYFMVVQVLSADEIQALPNDPALLKRMLVESNREKERLIHVICQLRRHQFGQRSEKIPYDQMLFAFVGSVVTETIAKSCPKPSRSVCKTPERGQGHGRTRRIIPPEIPRKTVVHDIPEEEKTCPDCRSKMEKFAEVASERVELEEPKLIAIRDVRYKYACPGCHEHLEIADAPVQPIPKCKAGPKLLAHVLVSKYYDHLPLYRQSRIFRRQGFHIARSTLCHWVGLCVEAVRPLYELLVQDVLLSKVIKTDDTPVKILTPGLGKTRQGHIWTYVGDENHPSTVYQFSPNHKQIWPKEFLAKFAGFLQADGYKGYIRIFAGGRIVHVGCMAHSRRKFYDAQLSDKLRAQFALSIIGQLYDIETQAADLSSAERRELRQKFARPILDAFKIWLDEQVLFVLPKSPIGKAVHYTRNQWEALNRYVDDGDLSIDNNQAENSLRNICLGRKNFLFYGSEGGGEWAAVIYSLIESAVRNGHDPFAYLADVLVRLPTHPIKQLAELLPKNWKPPPANSS